ncbi:MAG: response regulator transcription factor [Coriobacteriales bacterium]|nr:response regulator transcription factor [Coriobacteriales bacterium]
MSEDFLQSPAGTTAGAAVIRVLIVDDQALIRNGFRLLLSSYENIKVVGEASNGFEAHEAARTARPDVLLMDIRMPLCDGIQATRAILADPLCSQMRIIILTTFDLDEYVYNALKAGASGFLLKDIDPDDLLHAIEAVSQGDALIAPSITRRLIRDFVKVGPETAVDAKRLEALTEREREVLAYVAQGLTNTQIADVLVISPATVKTHVARIMTKLDAHDRAQLVIVAYETGLVTVGS